MARQLRTPCCDGEFGDQFVEYDTNPPRYRAALRTVNIEFPGLGIEPRQNPHELTSANVRPNQISGTLGESDSTYVSGHALVADGGYSVA